MNKKVTIEGINVIQIPAGSFVMGNDYEYDPALPPTVNRYYPDEQPIHKVTLKAFQMGETPITQGQFKKIMGENLSIFKGDDLPITNVSADEAEQFCNKLSAAAGYEPCYAERSREFDSTKNGFRLPTEAEWEYACRAGTTTRFYNGNTEKDLDCAGWYLGNSGGKTHPVAQKEPNPWGLYDMHGNVFEFCNDQWNPSLSYGKYLVEGEGNTNPVFYCYIDHRMTRGGDWFSQPCNCRSAVRGVFCDWSGTRGYHNGFRIARSI